MDRTFLLCFEKDLVRLNRSQGRWAERTPSGREGHWEDPGESNYQSIWERSHVKPGPQSPRLVLSALNPEFSPVGSGTWGRKVGREEGEQDNKQEQIWEIGHHHHQLDWTLWSECTGLLAEHIGRVQDTTPSLRISFPLSGSAWLTSCIFLGKLPLLTIPVVLCNVSSIPGLGAVFVPAGGWFFIPWRPFTKAGLCEWVGEWWQKAKMDQECTWRWQCGCMEGKLEEECPRTNQLRLCTWRTVCWRAVKVIQVVNMSQMASCVFWALGPQGAGVLKLWPLVNFASRHCVEGWSKVWTWAGWMETQ